MNDNNKDQDIMTLLEMSNYLKVSKKTIFRMIQKGTIKGFKVGNQWRFFRPVVDDWITNRLKSLPKKNLVKVINTANSVIPISDIITENKIIHNLTPGSKKDILAQLVIPLYEENLIDDYDYFLEKLLLRENMISTAIGHGIAFPHMRYPKENNIKKTSIVLGICPEGTNFKSLDNKKTYIFALICTNSELTHLRLLAKISLLLKQHKIISKLCLAKSKQEIMDIVKSIDIEISMFEKS